MPVVLVAMLALGAASPALAFSLPPAAIGGGAPAMPAPSASMLPNRARKRHSSTVRIQQLEEQIRTLNGQIEGLTFQLTQMQTLIERMTEDNEFRFQALEGGAGGKTDAATQPGGVTPSEVLPQDPANVPQTVIPEQGVRPLPGEAEADPTFTDGSAAAAADESGQFGRSAGRQRAGRGGGGPCAPAQPLDLTYDPSATVDTGDADADAQYTAGYEAIVRGDYAFAEDQFSQFLQLYPDNAQASDAANWLGEALIQRAAYDEAADVLLNAFQKTPDSPRAPDLLLKLGISLAGADERETACRTFAEIDKRYVNLTPAFVTRLAAEKTKAECPPA